MKYSVEFKKQYMTLDERKRLYEFVDWLEDNVGREWDMWQWKFGDVHARGVLFWQEEDAVAFKLRFDV